MKVFSHPDGGHYVRQDDTMDVTLKHPDSGVWLQAVIYREVDFKPGGGFMYKNRKLHVTTEARWIERFTEVEQ